jgi:ribonuclease G
LWWWKYKRWVDLVKDTSLGITEYHFLNGEGEEIELEMAEVKEEAKE